MINTSVKNTFKLILRLAEQTKVICPGGFSSLEFCRKFKLAEETTSSITIDNRALSVDIDEKIAREFINDFKTTNTACFFISIDLLVPNELKRTESYGEPGSFYVGFSNLSEERIIQLARYASNKTKGQE